MASISLGTSIFSSSQPPATKVKVAPPALFIWRAAFVRHPGVPAIGRNSAEFSWGQQHLLKTCAAEGLFPWDPGVLELRWWEKSGRCYPEKSENFKRLVPGSLYCRTKLCWHKVLRVGYHKGGTEVLKKVSDCKGRLVSGAVILSHFFKCRLQVNFTPFPHVDCRLPGCPAYKRICKTSRNHKPDISFPYLMLSRNMFMIFMFIPSQTIRISWIIYQLNFSMDKPIGTCRLRGDWASGRFFHCYEAICAVC